MGVYGTYGAFNGLGKPSIKLEFEDNESLVAFSKKMQDEEPAQWSAEEDMFTPVEGVAITEKEFYDLINANPEKYENYLIEYNDQNLDRLFPNHIDFGKKRYYKIHCNSPYFYDNTVYLPKAALKEHFFNHGRWVFGFILPTLQRPNIVFETDGEVNFVKTFERKNGTKTYVILTPVKKSETRVATTFNKERIENLYNKFKKGGSVLTYPFKEYLPVTTVNGVDTATRSFEIIDIHLPYITKNGAKSFVGGEKSLGAPGDTYIITDTRTRARKDLEDTAALKKYDIRKFSGEELRRMQTDDPLLYEQIKSDLQQQKTPIKQEVKTKEDWMQEVDAMLEVWKKEAFSKTTPQKYNEPGSRVKARYLTNLRNEIIKYFIDEIDKGNYERVSNIANVLGYKYADNERIAQTNGLISQFVGIVPTLPDGWRISKNIPKYLPKLPKGFVYIDNGKEMFDYRHNIMPAPASKEVNYRPDFPLSELYFKNKELHNHAILLFDFDNNYRAFLSDAVIVSTFCNLPIKKRGEVEICSVPKSDLAECMQRLGRNNFNVVVVDLPGDIAKKYNETLGKTANNALYNNLDILDFRGMKPTYRQLPNYDAFFDVKTVTNSQNFAGFGLDDTLKLIDETCRKYWKDCAKIAQHLKGDCKLQSAFNLWHWMRHNIRYEYDREGREEVRTPLRVWADRHRGVDCDCLSVFAYCVLKCMGYDPAFELVAFRNKPQYSHIFINLDGIVVDRVWFIFNSRPPGVTKRGIHKITMPTVDLGRLF